MVKGAQLSLEFVMIFVVVFLVFSVLVAVITIFAEEGTDSALRSKTETVADTIQSEIRLARSAAPVFSSQVQMPEDLDGVSYDVLIDEGADVLIVSAEDIYTTRSLPNVSGTFVPGSLHEITRRGGEIKIEPVP